MGIDAQTTIASNGPKNAKPICLNSIYELIVIMKTLGIIILIRLIAIETAVESCVICIRILP